MYRLHDASCKVLEITSLQRLIHSGFEHHSNAAPSIHLDYERRIEMHDTQVLAFPHGRLFVEECFVKPAFTLERIDGEIAYTERCHVLEKVGSLARLYAIVLETTLGDHSGLTYLRPLDGYAEIGITATPTAGSYKYVVAAFVTITPVDFLYVVSYQLIVHLAELIALYVDYICYV